VPPMKSVELHRLARQELGPQMVALGFKRIPGASGASWARSQDGKWLVVWLQPSQSNDGYAPGFRFTVELALSSDAIIGASGYRARLPTLLTDHEREELRRMENRTIAKLPSPDSAFARLLPAESRERWLAGWKPRVTPYRPDEDVWFRHVDQTDVRDLMAFFQRVLPEAVARFLERAASV